MSVKWLKNLQNPQIQAVKKFMYQMMGEDYHQFDDITERLIAGLITEHDVENFGKLIATIYEKGYLRSVEQHKDILEKLGMKVSVTHEQPNIEPTIFKDQSSEKSG